MGILPQSQSTSKKRVKATNNTTVIIYPQSSNVYIRVTLESNRRWYNLHNLVPGTNNTNNTTQKQNLKVHTRELPKAKRDLSTPLLNKNALNISEDEIVKQQFGCQNRKISQHKW